MKAKKPKVESDIPNVPFDEALKRVWSAPHKPKKKAVKKKAK